jgi:hypothetical protein
MSFLTLADTVSRLVDYLGGAPSGSVVRDCKQAAIEALRTFANAHNWTYLYTHGRIVTSPPYAEGTVSYSAADRTVTLAGGIWPAWSADGSLRIRDVTYPVATRVSANTLTLPPSAHPDEDLIAADFGLWRDTYPLPDDYTAQDGTLIPQNFNGLLYTHPREWLTEELCRPRLGQPIGYTIFGDPHRPGRLAFRVAPYPDRAYTIDFVYKRAPRSLLVFAESAGKVQTLTGSQLITGTGTAFNPDHVGCVIRVSGTPNAPTAISGENPAAFESVITAVASPTALTLAEPCHDDFAAAPYLISDPIDIEEQAMANAYLRCCEMHLSMNRVMKDKPSARQQYLAALEQAKCADSRCFTGRAAGVPVMIKRRLREYPLNLTVMD